MDPSGFVTLPKLLLLFVMLVTALAFGKSGRRWIMALGPLAVIAALAPWPDPVSMLISFAFLVGIFMLGVFWGPRLRHARNDTLTRSDS